MHVSVIITTFCRAALLEEALASVAAQTYTDFEVIVVNDDPNDAQTVNAICKRFGFNSLKIIHHQRSRGGNAARNSGIRVAEGEVVAFLDDDDLWHPDKLCRHVEKHGSNHDAGLVFSGYKRVWQGDLLPESNHRGVLPPNNPRDSLASGIFCPATSSLTSVRREVFATCGLFDEKLASFQDWDMWFRIAEQYQFSCIEEPLVIFRQHLSERTSQSLQKRLTGLEQIMQKWSGETDLTSFRKLHYYAAHRNHARNLALQEKRWQALTAAIGAARWGHSPKETTFDLLKSFVLLFVGARGYKALVSSLAGLAQVHNALLYRSGDAKQNL